MPRLSRLVRSALALIAVAALASCHKAPSSDRFILQREWTANAEFAGDVWAEDLSKDHGPVISVREGSESVDPVKMVRTGEAQVGVASADRVLRENEGGAGLVIIGAATYKSPVVFLSRPDARVRTPADFSGRVIGIQTNTNTELVFKSLVNKAHIDLKRLHVVESGWGTQNFETGNIDVLAAFDYDEPVQLSMKGFRFTVLNPEDFGVKYVGTVYFTRRSLLDEHPDQVQAFMDNLVNGWREALAHRDEAIRKIRSRFKIDVAKERQSLDRGAPYFAGEGGRPLFVAPERWQAMAQNLIALHLLKSFRYADNVNFTFLEGALSPKAN